ncbi:MAG: hypothetical protein KatS3mg129_1570 [Leptospiraceae bacterium]|nr:MAG: hypothetical protein KatS3mg129_1570 [Leptospiraceae bacterium]
MKKQLILVNIILTFLLISCKDKKVKIYEPTPEALSYGSLIYASSEVNCKNCHGIDYKGNGPDAKDLDISVPDFTSKIPAEKTPLDYFKAISVGTEKTIKNGMNYHAFYHLTDKAKWALANYLYSLSKGPETAKEKEIRNQALITSWKEVEEIYKKNRKWYMGENTPSTEREPAPDLNEIIQKTDFTISQDVPVKIISEQQYEKVFKARELYEDGYNLYKNNCQNCHGLAGEGVPGAKLLGILDESRFDPIKGICKKKTIFCRYSIVK